jgi:hypothetical protein
MLTQQRARKEMRALVEKYPDGLQEETKSEKKAEQGQSKVRSHSGDIELDPEVIAGKLSSISVRE